MGRSGAFFDAKLCFKHYGCSIKNAGSPRRKDNLMVKTIITGTVISKGFGSNPAIWFSEGNKSARFKVGYKVYDKKAENNTRWMVSLWA